LSFFPLPKSSGEITYDPDIRNSYGEKGCYYVGDSEIENPSEDIQYFAQMLSDAIAALEYQNVQIDEIAAKARFAYFSGAVDASDLNSDWDSLSEDYRERWRAVIRAVLSDAP
jgi:hypothetical protein